VLRGLGAAAAASLLVSLAVAAAPAQAAPATTVDRVTYSAPSITASGVRMVPQTVSAHITSAWSNGWLFELRATGGSGTVRSMRVQPTRSSGTDADGTWSATVLMPSTADGTWSLSTVYECGNDCQPDTSVTVPAPPTFTVTGHLQPRVSFSYSPDPVPYPRTSATITGRVVDADTNKGLPGLTVGYSSDNNCTNVWPDGPTGFVVKKRTSATGTFSFSPQDIVTRLQCLGLIGTATLNSDQLASFPWFQRFFGHIQPRVVAVPGARVAKVGAAVAVVGSYADGSGYAGRGATIALQRLTGRTQWRTLATVNVRLSGRWNGSVAVTVKGSNVFRALFPGYPAGGLAASSTKPFVITGT
jgi:hypothetical protein